MKIYKHLIIGLIVMFFSSCGETFLERPPLGSLDEDTYFGTDDSAMKLLTSCYNPMKDQWGFTINRVAIGSEVTDDADGGGSDAGDRPQTTEVGTGYPLSNNPLLQETWNNRYSGIGRCNIAIEKFSNEEIEFLKNKQPVSKETISRYLSEVKFLRALYYFDLVNTFGPVPLITEVQLPGARLEKSTIEEIRTQIYKDLDEAINDTNLPWKKNTDTATELGRVTKDAAYVLKARVALFFAGLMEQSKMSGTSNDEYIIARNASKEVIDNGNLALGDFQDLYGGDYIKGLSSSETILTVLNNYDPSIGHSTDAFSIMNVGRNNVGGWGGNVPTEDLSSSFDERDPRRLFTIISHGDIFPRGEEEEVHDYSGYYNFSLQQSRKAFVPFNYRVGGNLSRSKWAPYWIRYSEALLIYAEALLKTGGSNTEVAQYINIVRHRAFVLTSKKDDFAIMRKFEESLIEINDDLFNSDYAVSADDDLLQAIKYERRAEFAMEGLRLYDLIRWGDYVNKMKAFSSTYGYAGK
ncbi:MAG TPA: RagB/SusD family nutrient uptake outer membrane protein, partial [Fermentimonas sp.]|nr:RagB/SusD family nutrient uptake outer membrane protein [Fermentimonas sp.]